MNTKQIIQEMEKEFEKNFEFMREGFNHMVYKECKSFISSYTRKLIESVAEEIINVELWTGDGKGEGEELIPDGIEQAFLRQRQRLKEKEIISQISK